MFGLVICVSLPAPGTAACHPHFKHFSSQRGALATALRKSESWPGAARWDGTSDAHGKKKANWSLQSCLSLRAEHSQLLPFDASDFLSSGAQHVGSEQSSCPRKEHARSAISDFKEKHWRVWGSGREQTPVSPQNVLFPPAWAPFTSTSWFGLGRLQFVDCSSSGAGESAFVLLLKGGMDLSPAWCCPGQVMTWPEVGHTEGFQRQVGGAGLPLPWALSRAMPPGPLPNRAARDKVQDPSRSKLTVPVSARALFPSLIKPCRRKDDSGLVHKLSDWENHLGSTGVKDSSTLQRGQGTGLFLLPTKVLKE